MLAQQITRRQFIGAAIPTSSRPLAAAMLIWAASAIIPVHGASMQLPENDVVGLGTAFAGVGSSAQSPETAYENPAGLVKLPGVQVSLGGIFVRPQVIVGGRAQSGLGTPLSGSTQTDAGRSAIIPNAVASYEIGRGFAVGLAITSPFGTNTTYRPDWVGRYSALKTDVRTIDINPNLAYRITPWLSVGAGFSVQHITTVFSEAVNTSSIASAAYRTPITLPDGFVHLRQSDTGLGYNLGVLIEPLSGTRLGLTYRSEINYQLKGKVDFAVPAAFSASPSFAGGAIKTKYGLPDTARLSLTHAIGASWEGFLDATWTNWSRLKTLSISRPGGEILSTDPQNFRSTFALALGASVRATDRLALRAGLAYDKSPIRDGFRTLREPDGDRYQLSVGLSYKVLSNTTVDVAYAHIFMPPVSLVDVSQTGDVFQGHSRNSIDLFGLGVRGAF